MSARLAHRLSAPRPYALPPHLPPSLGRALAYWEGLLRGSAEVPFADDLKPTELPGLADRLLLIDVFERPARLRVQSVGKALGADDLAGRFLDEVRPGPPLDLLASQCEATLEAAAPSYFQSDSGRPHARLLLPLWGEGRISLILGVAENR